METLMRYDLPIEQLVRRTDTRFQPGFARQARLIVPDREEFALAPSKKGLHVLAKNEDGLAAPVEVLREAYGPQLEIQPPQVRLIGGVQVKEPIMQVRITLEKRLRDAVKKALQRRRATPTEEYAGSKYCVLRYEAPLAALLGLPAELSRLTGNKARHWTVLSHYAIVTTDPGGRAA
jgi:predicted membrane GTPase involved in stress response